MSHSISVEPPDEVFFFLRARSITPEKIKRIADEKIGAKVEKTFQFLGPAVAARMGTGVATTVASSVRFAHLALEIHIISPKVDPTLPSKRFYHGYGYDPDTGQVAHSDSRKPSLLGAFLLSPEQHDENCRSSGGRSLGARHLPSRYKRTAVEMVARLLQVGAATNKAQKKYKGAHPLTWPNPRRTPPPPNSTAVLQASLEHAGLIRHPEDMKQACPGYLLPGMRYNLLQQLTLEDDYARMAAQGATIPQLFEEFEYRMPYRPAPPSEPHLSSAMATASLVVSPT